MPEGQTIDHKYDSNAPPQGATWKKAQLNLEEINSCILEEFLSPVVTYIFMREGVSVIVFYETRGGYLRRHFVIVTKTCSFCGSKKLRVKRY